MEQSQRVLLGIVLLVVGGAIGASVTGGVNTDSTPPEGTEAGIYHSNTSAGVDQFKSPQAFRAYVQRGRRLAQQETGFVSRPNIVRRGTLDVQQPTVVYQQAVEGEQESQSAEIDADAGGSTPDSPSQPNRVSETNVQEQGIDEPDILKNDGTHAYYAPRQSGGFRYRSSDRDPQSHVIAATPPGDPTQVSTINDSGRFLRTGDRLVVIQDEQLVGYDVSDPDDPTQVWEQPLADSLVTARLADGSITLVTKSSLSVDDPCSIEPMGDAVTIPCTDVYHPRQQTAVDATYTALSVDPTDGTVHDSVGFVGTSEQTSVYMSTHGLYVTYTQQTDRGTVRIDFLLEQQDRFPTWVTTRLTELREYNISSTAKQTEANRILRQWYDTLDADRRQTVQTEIHNDYQSYLAANQRQLLTTGLVQIAVDGNDLAVETVGTVPGKPLNQFSVDEHDGQLRITTTVPRAGTNQSRNDLYVLDNETLEQRGAVKGMGINERVYSVRYVEDTAYVVTFRRIDPFHIVDLSSPEDPVVTGELKLPGFSSYLHPIDENHVLGIGKENGEVKAVLFDVSDPTNPLVDDAYVLDSRWSAVDDSHHAFLLDRRHGVFFLPTGDGGKIIDYTDGNLSLETAVDTDGNALRAMYVNDYLYVFGSDEIAVIDENSWNRTKTIQLN